VGKAQRAHPSRARIKLVGTAQRRLCPRYALDVHQHSRGTLRPSFAFDLLPRQQRAQATLKRGRRESRVRGAPAAPCAKGRKHTVVDHRFAGHPAFPAQWFYDLLRALPGDRACLPPSPHRKTSARLDASVGASGPHDFAVRLSAVRQKRIRVHRFPSQRSRRWPTSLFRNGMPPYAADLRRKETKIFLPKGLDRPNHLKMIEQFRIDARRAFSTSATPDEA
jgi:hypothetical protein